MLQKLSERIQGIVAWSIIGVVAFTFTLFGIDSYLQSHHTNTAEAKVNGQPISKQAFDLQYRRVRQAQEASGNVSVIDEKILKQRILDDMIAMKANVHAAQKSGFGLDASIANAAILKIPQFQSNGHFSPDKYQQAINNALFTPQSFQEEVSQGMLLNQQRFAFIGTAFTLSHEVEQFVKLYGQTRDYRYVQIPSRIFLSQAEVSPDEIQAYYEKHKSEFLEPEKVQLEVVKLSMSAVKESLKPNDKALEAYYESNQSNYMAPARWSVQHILLEVPEGSAKTEWDAVYARANALYEVVKQSPKQFEAKGILQSKKHPGRVRVGVMPWIVAGESAFDTELVQLTAVGDITAPIKTDAGYEIFQLLAYEPKQLKPFHKVKNEVLGHWLSDNAQVQYAKLQEILSEQSYQTPDTLEPVAKALGVTTEKTAFLSREGGNDELTQNARLLQAAFSHDVLKLGNNSQPVQINDDLIVVVRVVQHQNATEKPLHEVRDDIHAQLREQKAMMLARQLGEQLLQENVNYPQDDKLFVSHHLAWQTVTHATRDSSLAPEEVNQIAFTITEAKPRVGMALKDNTGYVVVELKSMKDGELEALDSEQVASISQQISANHGSVDYELYVAHILGQAKISRDQ